MSQQKKQIFQELVEAFSEPKSLHVDDDDDDDDDESIPWKEELCENEKKLFLAAEYNDVENAKKIVLEHGVNPNVADEYGFRPIHAAAESANCEFIEAIVVSLGADINARENNGLTLLADRAMCSDNFTKVLKTFVKLGGDVNLPDFNGNTALHNSVNFCTLSEIKELIDAGANLFAKNKRGENVLAYARRTLDKNNKNRAAKIDYLVERFITAVLESATPMTLPAPATSASAAVRLREKKRPREETPASTTAVRAAPALRRSPRFN